MVNHFDFFRKKKKIDLSVTSIQSAVGLSAAGSCVRVQTQVQPGGRSIKPGSTGCVVFPFVTSSFVRSRSSAFLYQWLLFAAKDTVEQFAIYYPLLVPRSFFPACSVSCVWSSTLIIKVFVDNCLWSVTVTSPVPHLTSCNRRLHLRKAEVPHRTFK